MVARETGMTLLVSGWVAIDDVETPFENRKGLLGGSATPAALAASLFTKVRLLAAVGEDFPDEHRTQLEAASIDTRGLVIVPGAQSSKWGGRYHYDMNTRDTLYTELGVNADWQPSLPEEWQDSDSIFCAAGDPVVQKDLIQSLDRPRASLVDTIKLYIDSDADAFRETMGVADFVAINDSEARMLAGTASIARASSILLATGTRGVVVKLGEYGAAYRSPDDYFVAPGYPLEDVIDPTGAGDAFAGGFMGYLDSVDRITPAAIRRAIVYGSTVASFQVEDFGPARLLRLTRDEVEARYRQFRALTHFEVDE
jgi:sugar/nucleoside kinase (ribokinase family)